MRGADPGRSLVDAQVGSRIRLSRAELAMSRHQLGKAIGITRRQVYRASVTLLQSLRLALGVPVSFFFDDDLTSVGHPGATNNRAAAGDEPDLLSREVLEPIRAYRKISDPAARQRLIA